MVAHLFDERDGAVEKMISMAIDAAHRAGKKIGICGQAPSDYPEFARFLVDKGITSISLNPDTVMQTTRLILDAEKELATGARAAVSLEEAAEVIASELNPIYVDEVV